MRQINQKTVDMWICGHVDMWIFWHVICGHVCEDNLNVPLYKKNHSTLLFLSIISILCLSQSGCLCLSMFQNYNYSHSEHRETETTRDKQTHNIPCSLWGQIKISILPDKCCDKVVTSWSPWADSSYTDADCESPKLWAGGELMGTATVCSPGSTVPLN